MKKLTDILKEAGIKLDEKKKDDLIYVPGLARYDYKGLKRNVEKKLKDLTRRNKQSAHYGVGKNQFSMLSAMWLALQEYEEKK